MELYVRYWTPGIIVAESWDVRISTLDLNKVPWPDRAYAFQLVEKASGESEDGIAMSGERMIDGLFYYHPDSQIVPYNHVPASETALRSNMRCNDWDCVIYTRWNNWPQPYKPEKHVILPSGEDHMSEHIKIWL